MASISLDGASSFNQIEGAPLLPHQPIEEWMDWFSSESHCFLSADSMLASIEVPTQAGNTKVPEHAHANAHMVYSEGITTLATATIPLSGRAVPAMVIVSLLPLHVGTGQYPPFLKPSSPPPLDKAGRLSQLPPSHPAGPSYLSVDDFITGSYALIDPRYDLGYAPTSSSFPFVPSNSDPRPEERYVYQSPGHGEPIQEPIPNGIPQIVIASPDVADFPPSFNQTPGSYLVSGRPPSPSLVNRGIICPTHTTHKNKENRQTRPFSRTHQTNSTEPVRGSGVDRHSSRHQCTICDASYARPSGLNRHYKDKHMAWVACHYCNSEFSLGRKYKFTEHLQTCPGA